MAMSRSFGGTSLTTRSPMRMEPDVIVSSPAISASSVDLPQPDGPTSTTNSPELTSRLMPWSTGRAPKFLLRLLRVSDAMVISSGLFDRALGQAAYEIPPAEEVDE